MKTFSWVFFLLCGSVCAAGVTWAQDVRVNEALARNGGPFADEDGDSSDWIELLNVSADTVQLRDYGLTDDPGDPFKWTLPHVSLAPGEYVLIFASGKDRVGLQGEWETVVRRGDIWRYYPGTLLVSADWIEPGFDAGAWNSGASGIGYGDGDDATPTVTLLSLFARHTFEVGDASTVTGVEFHIDYDDAFVAYLNGVEFARENVGTPGQRVLGNQAAHSGHEAALYQGLPIDGFSVPDSLLVDGQNVLAVQVHNTSLGSSDLSMIPFLSTSVESDTPSLAGVDPEILESFNKEVHAGFKLSSDETVCLTSPDLSRQDCLPLQDAPVNTSVGRAGDGSVALYSIPTPGTENSSGSSGVAPEVAFSKPAGVYQSAVTLTFSFPDSGRVVFTRDGAEPNETSATYTVPLTISQTGVVRARVLVDGKVPGPAGTATYVVGEEHDLPIASIVTEPDLLFHPVTGMYEFGPGAENQFPYFGANFWEDREIPVHLDWIETDGAAGVSQTVGMKIFGGWSRGHPQKSFTLFARGRYGADAFRHRFFDDRPYDEYQSLVLRNSGNDWNRSMLRDGFMQSLVEDSEIDVLSYRPTAVYINGEYWGLHNLREKINEHYVQSVSGADPESIDLVELNTEFNGGYAIHGTTEAWDALISRVSASDIQTSAAYADVRSMMDVDNFIDYQIAQIYFDNRDWPGNNIKVWRDRNDGRFRWILYDTDFGWGIWNADAWGANTLLFATDSSGPSWPNPPWSTLLFRRLLLNEQFRIEYVNRFADFLNVHFERDAVVAALETATDVIGNEIERHAGRWGMSTSDWDREIDAMQFFAQARHPNMLFHAQQFFGLGDRSPVSVTVFDGVGGRIVVNRESVRETSVAPYFDGVQLPITAIPDPGYRFDAWSGSITGSDRMLSVDPADDISITARFVADPGDPSAIVVNEIQYNPAGLSGEWVELVNIGPGPASVGGWTLSDGSGTLALPTRTLSSGGFAILCESAAAFDHAHAVGCDAELPFRLGNGGDVLVLRNALGVVADSVAYDDTPPWPSKPDGSGHSLELQDALADNSVASAWRPSVAVGGSPGKANATSTAVELQESSGRSSISVFPNPFANDAAIAAILVASGDVVIEVYDVLGRRLAAAHLGFVGPGEHTIRGVLPSASVGVLFVRLLVDGRPEHTTTAVRVR